MKPVRENGAGKPQAAETWTLPDPIRRWGYMPDDYTYGWEVCNGWLWKHREESKMNCYSIMRLMKWRDEEKNQKKAVAIQRAINKRLAELKVMEPFEIYNAFIQRIRSGGYDLEGIDWGRRKKRRGEFL